MVDRSKGNCNGVRPLMECCKGFCWPTNRSKVCIRLVGFLRKLLSEEENGRKSVSPNVEASRGFQLFEGGNEIKTPKIVV